MAYRDLRQYIQRLEEEGELTQIDAEVDWDLEAGAISRRAINRRNGAILFNRIKGYPPGFRLMANLLGPGRPVHALFSLALGHPKDTPVSELINWVGRKTHESLRPVMVDSAPCKENILKGPDVDLTMFPSPRIHGIDGGRYLGTWHINVTRDPDTGWVNWGMYRHQLLDSRRLAFQAIPTQHGPSIYFQKYEPKGEAMPMAIALGTDPLSSIGAGAGIPAQTNEVDMVGAMQDQPVQLVKCETINLEVPASAEIILEGHVPPYERELEGPFGEFTGYCAGGQVPRPVFHVDCITFRNDPILTMSNMGKPWDELTMLHSVVTSAIMSEELHKQGIPFQGLYCAPPSLATIVAARPPYAGFIHSVASAVWASKPGLHRPYVFLVGDDVDPTNMEDVFWCLTTRMHPSTGIHVHHEAPGGPMLPFLSKSERRAGRSGRVAIDATFPTDWPSEDFPQIMDFENGWPAEVQERVIRRWEEFGLK